MVSILVAFLVKSDRRDRLPQVWVGVALAVALSVVFGALLDLHRDHLLGHRAAGAVRGGHLGRCAVVFVTWMIFWMRRAARADRR